MPTRPIRIEGDVAYVPLTQGKFALIDAADVALIDKWNWCLGAGYAMRNERLPGGKRRCVYMHRVIANTPDGMATDHINRDKLDNRRANLRHASHSENQHNRAAYRNNASGFKGVSWDKARSKWCAYIRVDGKERNLGGYLTPEMAHAAYTAAAIRYHGAFARVE